MLANNKRKSSMPIKDIKKINNANIEKRTKNKQKLKKEIQKKISCFFKDWQTLELEISIDIVTVEPLSPGTTGN